MKPVNLSVWFIHGEREPYSDNFSDSEQSEGTSDSEDNWESYVSLVEEDGCFYDVVRLVNSQDMHLIPLFQPGHRAQILRQI